MVDQNCAYCVEGELLAKFGINWKTLKYIFLKSRAIREELWLLIRNMSVRFWS